MVGSIPNAACVVSLVDRLIHHSEIISLDGESYRLKEAQELAEKKSRQSRRNHEAAYFKQQAISNRRAS